MFPTKLFSVILLGLIGNIVARDLPSYFPRCSRDDPNINECILKAAEEVRPHLKKGIPELNIPSISTLIFPEIVLQQGTPAVNYKATIKDLKIHGLDEFKFAHAEMDLANLTFSSTFIIEDILLESVIDLNGKVLAIPVQGVGTLDAKIKNVTAHTDCQLRFVEKKSIKYLEVVTLETHFHVGKVLYGRINGLFENKELEDVIYRVIDDNMTILVEELKPAIEKVLGQIIRSILMKSFSRVPFDKLFPVGNTT